MVGRGCLVLTVCLVLVPAVKAQESFAAYQKKVADCLAVINMTIDMEPFQDEMKIAQVLSAIHKQLPKEKKIQITVDRKAFGNEIAVFEETNVRFPPFPKRMTVGTLLRLLLSRVALENARAIYRVEPGQIVLSTPEKSRQTFVHDVADLVKQAAALRAELMSNQNHRMIFPGIEDIRPDDGTGLLVQILQDEPGKILQVINGTRLVIEAENQVHFNIAGSLDSLRGLLDTGVVLHARVYEMERKTYADHVAPLFREGHGAANLVECDNGLLRTILKQRLVTEGNAAVVKPRRQEVFLALEKVYRYQARPGKVMQQADQDLFRTGLEGVTFAYSAVISGDRRCVRLQVSQKVRQLMALEKTRVLDPASGKEGLIEVPSLRTKTMGGSIELHDGAAFVMPVDYLPAAKDKVWVLLAQPYIYIEDEVRALKAEGGQQWQPFIPEEEKKADKEPEPGKKIKEAQAKELPRSEEVEQILQALLADVLTNPEHKGTRDFYGTPGEAKFILEETREFSWPKWFKADVRGFTQVQQGHKPAGCFRNRILGIRIDGLDLTGLDKNNKKDERTYIHLVVENAGGSTNGGVIGACNITYVPRWDGKKWGVQWTLVDD